MVAVVGQDINTRHLSIVPLQRVQHFPRPSTPKLHSAVKRRRRQIFTALGIKPKLRYKVRVGWNRGSLLASPQIPNLDGTIVSGCRQLEAVDGMELGIQHTFRMSQKMSNRLARSQVPNLDNSSKVSRRAQATIWVKANTVNLFPVSILQQQHLLIRFNIPQSPRVIETRGCNVLFHRMKRRPAQSRGVPFQMSQFRDGPRRCLVFFTSTVIAHHVALLRLP